MCSQSAGPTSEQYCERHNAKARECHATHNFGRYGSIRKAALTAAKRKALRDADPHDYQRWSLGDEHDRVFTRRQMDAILRGCIGAAWRRYRKPKPLNSKGANPCHNRRSD